MRGCVRMEEAQQTLAFLADLGAILAPIGSTGRMTSVAAMSSRMVFQIASEEAVHQHEALQHGPPLWRGSTIRLRSLCDRKTLSYSGRKRTGAGVSGSGSGPSGTSNSSRPASSRNVRSRGPQPLQDGADGGQPRPGLDVGRSGGAERRQVAQHQVVNRRIGRHRPPRPTRRSAPGPAVRGGPTGRAAGSGRAARESG